MEDKVLPFSCTQYIMEQEIQPLHRHRVINHVFTNESCQILSNTYPPTLPSILIVHLLTGAN